MKAPNELRRTPGAAIPAPLTDYSGTIRNLRRLIILYIVLLVFEGALRKWVVPQLSNPLLIIRDPVVILIYLLAWRARVFPKNMFVLSLGIIAVLSVALSIFVLISWVPLIPSLEVTAFGFRSNFLHLPLIFVMAKVFDGDDVRHIGWWILLGMIPMGVLMVLQFQASPEAFINRTVGLGEAQQLTAGGGKIRPPGTFSFISGPVFYMSVATAFLIHGALTRSAYKTWLLAGSGAALVVGVAVSGSRSSVASVLLVVLSVVLILFVRPQAVNQFGRILVIGVVAALIIVRLPFFNEGVKILSDRFASEAELGETTVIGGMLDRTVGGFTEGLSAMNKFPMTGYGLGVGTNGGGRFLFGRAGFFLSENEWTRVLAESGPILGFAFLLWRTVLTCWLFYRSLVALNRGATLPILLFGSGFVALLNGQLGQPTNLGFAAVLCGLCLASTRTGKSEVPAPSSRKKPKMPNEKRLPRVSEYASRLHGSSTGSDQTNGFVDR